jgi:hypothetical protein
MNAKKKSEAVPGSGTAGLDPGPAVNNATNGDKSAKLH